ncbi:MAG: ABC transporter permease [Oribacterium sp.]|nr:ABC transporter permease [Oribacterium sp.]
MSEKVSAVVFKILIPILAISFMVLFCYPVCNKPEGFDYFLFWILVGFPFGIRRMWLWLIPRNYGIAGSLGVMALNCIVGGVIGGFVAIITLIKAMVTTGQIITGRL